MTLTPYRGASVSETLLQDSIEQMQIRRGLEVLAAQLAAEARGGDVRQELMEVVERSRDAGQEHRLDDVPSLMMEFHVLVAQASGNRQLQVLLDRVLQRISWGFVLDLEERVEASWTDHAVIAAAILNGSPVQAGLLMGEHAGKDEAVYRQKYPEGAT